MRGEGGKEEEITRMGESGGGGRREIDRHDRRDAYLLVQLSPHSVLGLHLSRILLGSDNGPSRLLPQSRLTKHGLTQIHVAR